MTVRPGDFGTAISCIDGRVQQPVSDWLKLYCHVRWVDLVTEPGPDRLLAAGPAVGLRHWSPSPRERGIVT